MEKKKKELFLQFPFPGQGVEKVIVRASVVHVAPAFNEMETL